MDHLTTIIRITEKLFFQSQVILCCFLEVQLLFGLGFQLYYLLLKNSSTAYFSTKAGASLGSAIGSLICPGVGTVIGGFIGGIAGGIAGGYAGDKLGEVAGDYIGEDVSNGVNKVVDFLGGLFA